MRKRPTKLDIYYGAYVEGLAADRVFAMCRHEDRATMGRVTMLFWSIWQHRNGVVWNDSLSLPNQVVRIAYEAWNDWFVVHHLKHDENYIFAVHHWLGEIQQVTLSTVEGEAWALLQAMWEANLR
ncbi:hypothetical protein L195_g020360, partial [Trifolium pratense]